MLWQNGAVQRTEISQNDKGKKLVCCSFLGPLTTTAKDFRPNSKREKLAFATPLLFSKFQQVKTTIKRRLCMKE